MVALLCYFSFQPVFHDWCNKDRGVCYPVCVVMYIQEHLLLIGKSSPCGGRGFSLSLSPSFTSYEAGTSPDWDGDTKVCLFKYCQKRHCLLLVPSHTGIKDNENADSAAKSALDLPCAKVGVPYTDFKQLISQYICSTWQDDWNGAVINKLHSVKPVLGDWQSSYRRCRKDEVVLCRARTGHTHLTHSYNLIHLSMAFFYWF